ncbi:MAG: serine/threonine-protein kinase [Gemmatimonadales bacterium]
MAGQLEALRSEIGDRYHLVRALGAGGMATVYLAHDRKHERDVAVKVLRPELSAAIGTDRFLREIRITARLNHPHVLPLLDSGEAGNLLYYVMPYLSGGSLRHRLTTDGRLPLDSAVRIASQVAAALEHAHRLDVVHRDIKPENILFSEGLAIVADFGIARAITKAGGDALTRSGFPLGTPGYMSPEQAAGAANVGPPTDVFGLACVTYEMLVGETPEMWPSEEAIRVGRFLDASTAHQERLDALPGRLQQVLVQALAVRPTDRYPTPTAFAEALAAAAVPSAKLDDQRVRAVLERAAVTDAESDVEPDALSIGGVEQVAAQVGIPPDRVRNALDAIQPATALPAEVARGAVSTWDRKKDRVIVDCVAGAEASAKLYPLLVDAIQRHLGLAGHTSVLGSTLTWSPASPGVEGRKVIVTVTAAAGQTLVHIEERFEVVGWKFVVPAWGAAGGGLVGLGLGTLMGVSDPQIAVPALIGAFSGGFLAIMGLLHIPARRRRPELEALADRLAGLIEGPSDH